MEYPGDIAVRVATDFQDKWLATVDEDMLRALDEVADLHIEKRRTLFTKMEFRWRPADRKFLEQVRLSGDMTIREIYGAAQAIMDEFYASMRVPETQVIGSDQVAVLDSSGRQVFKKNEHGDYIEDISQLTGQDIEQALLNMERVRFVVSTVHAQLLSEAILARNLYDDRREAGYESLLEGTQGDRNARAARESRRDKYKAYFHWHLYQSSNAFLLEIDRFTRLLDRMAERHAWTGRRRRD
jgi:hypothetical protein